MKLLLILAALCWATGVGSAQVGGCETTEECQKVLEGNPKNSSAHYRLAQLLSSTKNYVGAANQLRAALNGDLEPKWIEVWSHIQLGKIFDATNQRARAVNEYNQALRTRDNTEGALDEAGRYLQMPYAEKKSK